MAGLTTFAMRRAIDTAGHDVGALIVHRPIELPGAWPWADAWTALLAATSDSGKGGGSKLTATELGAAMRVRSGQLGFGALDYAGDAGTRSAAEVAGVWRSSQAGARLGELVVGRLEALALIHSSGPTRPYRDS